MDSNGSDVSQADSCKFVVLDSQEESPFPAPGERTLLSTLPGLHIENVGVSVSDVSMSEDRQKTGADENLSDEESPPARIAITHVTDTGSEAEPSKIQPSQRPPIIVAETETQSDTDGGVISDTAAGRSMPEAPLDGSSDDPDKTIKAPLVVDVSEGEKTLQGDQDSSGRSSGKYLLGSGIEWELSHTQGAHLTSKSRGQGSPAVRAQDDTRKMHSPKDLFAAQESDDDDDDDKQGVLTPSEHISSLQVSQALVPETLDNDSLEDIPPSVEAYGSIPVIIPSSPTAQVSDKDSSEDEPGSYRPEELSTLDPDTKHKPAVGGSTSGSGSSSRSGKQSVESENKSTGNSRESIKVS
ncbi:uncharacterized protein LOC135473267 [Liolophura sinensis]|uniref:uncharacterized protein LOC135473267 n=1 Tax=Liolophura sinensis TaxID=3198878 RepID=UPI0031582353